ncbi:Delta(7)-sterol 5(6)-desaturase erg3B [Aspergillus wentii]
MYLTGSTIIYFTLFDRKTLHHPRHHPNQIRLEIQHALSSMPVMALLTVPFFLAEIHGYSKLYDFTTEAPFAAYTYLQYPLFLLFTDAGIYWIHRGLHHRSVYGWLHKPHHRWIVPSPFASYAFHPIDGWSQSLPYHVFPLILPLQKGAYLGLFGFVTVWTLFIHDAEFLSSSKVVNGPACHTMHHLYFNYNYGQYTTFWDRFGGTYYKPRLDKFGQAQKEKDGSVSQKDD